MNKSINQITLTSGNNDYMPKLHEIFERRTSTQEEYDILYNSDNLYIAWGNKGDDVKLLDFVSSIGSEYYDWHCKIRGDTKSTSKIGNAENDSKYCQGYIFSVTKDQMDLFEKVALMPSMKYGYRFEKYDINDLKEKERQSIIDALSNGDIDD